jgi:hypothetical protein
LRRPSFAHEGLWHHPATPPHPAVQRYRCLDGLPTRSSSFPCPPPDLMTGRAAGRRIAARGPQRPGGHEIPGRRAFRPGAASPDCPQDFRIPCPPAHIRGDVACRGAARRSR